MQNTKEERDFIVFCLAPISLLMIRSSLTCCLVLLSPLLKAQEDTLSKYIPAYAYTVVYSEPLALLDGFNGMSGRLGVEHAWNKKLAVYGTGGVYFEQGYMFRVGIKRFFHMNDDNARYYWGIDYMHNWHIHTVHDHYSTDESKLFSFTEEKNMHILDFTMGMDLDKLYDYHEGIYERASATPGNSLVPDLRAGIRIGRVFAVRRRQEY